MNEPYNHEAVMGKVQSLQDVLELKMNMFEKDTRESLTRIEAKQDFTNGQVRWSVKMIFLAMGGLGVLSIIVFPLLWALITSGKL